MVIALIEDYHISMACPFEKSGITVKMCMKDLCSDTDRGKPKWSWKILLQ
jgi:hypothetical protein